MVRSGFGELERWLGDYLVLFFLAGHLGGLLKLSLGLVIVRFELDKGADAVGCDGGVSQRGGNV